MTALKWGQTGDKRFETGTDHGVLYLADEDGDYNSGYAWNGLTGVTESPSGAEANKQYADNGVYLNITSAEEYGGTIEAFTYPDEFAECNGEATPVPGVAVGQQSRRLFGFSWRTKIGDDVSGQDAGEKIHLVWGAQVAPSERAYTTINDSPEATALSWEFTTTPTSIEGYPNLKPTASITVNSMEADEDAYAALLEVLYGTTGTDPRLPSPGEVLDMLAAGTTTTATPTAPTYNSTTKVITIPTVTGVVYEIDGEPVSGTVTITEDTLVTAHAAPGYSFPEVTDDDWFFDF